MSHFTIGQTFVGLVLLLGKAKAAPAGYQSCVRSIYPTTASMQSQCPSFRPRVFQQQLRIPESIGSYWAAQKTQTQPECVVAAKTVEHVQKAVQVLSKLNARSAVCQFAVRADGHGKSGNSNQQGGVSVDLRALNAVTVSADQKMASIGAGAHWQDVASELDALSLAVPGGRAGTVGVGGLSLAGGISSFAPSVGFACDNVLSFEVVLSSGEVVIASERSNSDLHRALRGGGNNFGVVTRVNYQTFPLQKMWGGTTYYDVSTYASQLKAFYDFTSDPNYDDRAYGYQTFELNAQATMALNNFAYTEPTPDLPRKLKALNESAPMLFSTLRISNVSDLIKEQAAGSPAGFRQIAYTTTFHLNQDMLEASFKVWNASLAAVRAVPNITYSWTLEPLPRPLLAQSTKRGGNVLGLSKVDQPLTTAKQVLTDIDALAKELAVFHPWKYAGYAAKDQAVIQGYGQDNVAFLKQKAVPGGFKLEG
ncbi:FAD-binding domain-containing protein [Byssothecium circinans]|uniref:FAD-binding domain-containing protein n=1 Tax=Byssothecium circinans TaxID=147558 RepID=A0A6A5TPL7_9PLEO|nr:FAD-binding domain-containing protein [Byssothecium circinans]